MLPHTSHGEKFNQDYMRIVQDLNKEDIRRFTSSLDHGSCIPRKVPILSLPLYLEDQAG